MLAATLLGVLDVNGPAESMDSNGWVVGCLIRGNAASGRRREGEIFAEKWQIEREMSRQVG